MSRLTPGIMTVVVFALFAGLAGAYVVRHHLNPQTRMTPLAPAAAQEESGVIVPVALTDLEKDRAVTLDDIAIMRFSREEFGKSDYAKKTFLPNSQQIDGRRLRTSLKKGEAFTPENFYASGEKPGILERLQAGYRGVTIPVQNIGAVQGFARPGSFVDVLFRSSPEGKHSEVTLTLLERIEVLALDQDTIKPSVAAVSQVGSVTLAVTPQQAKILKVVEGRGELSLTLRHPEDDFQFAPFDPALERSISGLTDGAAMLPTAFPATAARKAASKSAAPGIETIDGVDSVIGNAAERLTLSDLLGMTSDARQTTMEIYRGGTGSPEVLIFDEPANDSPELLRSGSRIRTPIVDFPTKRRGPLGGTAQLGN